MTAHVIAMPATGTAPLLWSPFTFDPGALVWTFVVFGLVVFILAKAAWKPLIEAFEKRERTLKDEFARAERAEREARRAAAETEAKLKEAYAKADQIVEDTRARGEKLSQELSAQAKAQADKLLQRAKEEIAAAKTQAAEELRTQAVELALDAASAVLNKSLHQDDQRRVAREAIDLMQKESAS